MGKFKISCDEATAICDKNQYGNATFSDKLKIMLHLVYCKVCKCYSKQNSTMSEIYGNYAKHKCNESCCLSKEDKDKMEESVKEKMK